MPIVWPPPDRPGPPRPARPMTPAETAAAEGAAGCAVAAGWWAVPCGLLVLLAGRLPFWPGGAVPERVLGFARLVAGLGCWALAIGAGVLLVVGRPPRNRWRLAGMALLGIACFAALEAFGR